MAKRPNLHDELVTAGASAEEASELTRVARALRHLPTPEPFLPALRSGWSWPRVTGLAAAAAAAFFMIGGGMVSMAQTSRPGTALYPVKRASDQVIVNLDPAYAGHVMMQQAEDIDILAQAHGSADVVMNEVADYQQMAPRAKLDSATRGFCMWHLGHAARLTSGGEQRAIQSAMQPLYSED